MQAHDVGLLVMEEDVRVGIGIAQAAESAGIGSLWSIEFYNKNPFVRLATWAAHTQRITLGTSIAVAFARAPLLLATAAADLDDASGGRFQLGLGTSTKRMNTDWYGIPFEHPAPRLTELVRLLRELLRHQDGPFTFEGRFHHIQLGHYHRTTHTRPDLPILTAGVNPRMVSVAGEVGDGFVGHPLATEAYLTKVAVPAITKGAARSGRDPNSVQITSQVIASVSDDVKQARHEAALQVAFYATVAAYDVILDLGGFQEEKQAIRHAFRRNDPQAMAAAVSDKMLDQMAIFGTATDVRDQLERYETVLDLPVLYPPHFALPQARIRENHFALIDAFR